MKLKRLPWFFNAQQSAFRRFNLRGVRATHETMTEAKTPFSEALSRFAGGSGGAASARGRLALGSEGFGAIFAPFARAAMKSISGDEGCPNHRRSAASGAMESRP